MNNVMDAPRMTLTEIEEQFDNEWILVIDPEFDTNHIVIGGKVLWHSKNRDEVYQKDKELCPRNAAYLYTGPNPENLLINL
jgi:hypothetical protein